MANLRIVVHREIPENEDLRHEWNGLLEQAKDRQVFYTHEWALAVQRAYGDRLHPHLFLGYEQESLCAVAALAIKSDEATFLCATTADYCDFLSATDKRLEFVSLVFSELRKRGVHRMAFANLPADSNTLDCVRQASQQQKSFCFARTGYVCARISFAGLEKNRQGKMVAPGLKRVRRFRNAMARETPLRLEHSRSWDEVQPIIPQFIQAHVARFLEIGRISNFTDERRRVFLVELAKLLAPAQWVVLSRIVAGERPVAWHYGFRFHDSWFWYQPTFDGSFEKYWPGFCLLSQVIQEATEDPALTNVDLGLGSEAYKAKFANGSRETLYVTVHDSLLQHFRGIFRFRIAEVVRAKPAVEQFAESTRDKVQNLSSRLRKDGAKKTLKWMWQRSLRSVAGRDEVIFYEFVGRALPRKPESFSIVPIDLNLLANAAMQHPDDEGTLAYLLRCAPRLRKKEYAGFALLDEKGQAVHFTWAGPFAGFHWAELNSTLATPSPQATLLFDCWTPVSHRGRGYYGVTVAAVAAELSQRGQQAWIFSASSNEASIRGLEKMDFARRFSVIRHRLLWWQKLTRDTLGHGLESEALAA